MYEKQQHFLIRLAYVVSLILLGWLLLRYFLVWLLPFLIALALATLTEPVISYCRQKLHFKRNFTAAVFTLILVGGLLALSVWLVTQLLRQAYELLEYLPQMLSHFPAVIDDLQQRLDGFCQACPASVRTWIDRALGGISTQLTQWVTSLSSTCLHALSAAVTALPQVFLFCATTALAVFFTVSSFPSVMAFFRRQLQSDSLETARGIKTDLLTTLGKWLKAQCILIGITFLELLAGLLLLREHYALLLAVLIAVIDALPVFGTGTVLIPWGALCLLAGNFPRGLALLALYAVITLVRSITEPKIMAAQVNLPPLAALLAMYVGFCTLGVVGMIFFPMLLLFVKQLCDSGYLKLWK
ncbi:MAG: sporulation integral membrane protein YtvI [Clostridiales bacterium]|nr:sporulation integral membrane protein YtvI [Candidatus Cacconaster stercorequi]